MPPLLPLLLPLADQGDKCRDSSCIDCLDCAFRNRASTGCHIQVGCQPTSTVSLFLLAHISASEHVPQDEQAFCAALPNIRPPPPSPPRAIQEKISARCIQSHVLLSCNRSVIGGAGLHPETPIITCETCKQLASCVAALEAKQHSGGQCTTAEIASFCAAKWLSLYLCPH